MPSSSILSRLLSASTGKVPAAVERVFLVRFLPHMVSGTDFKGLLSLASKRLCRGRQSAPVEVSLLATAAVTSSCRRAKLR